MAEANEDLDYGTYAANRRRIPPEALEPYSGHHVAFSLDGKHILASGRGLVEVETQLRAAGLDPSQVVFSYIDPPDLVQL